MRHILLWTLAAMMIATAPAVTVMAEGNNCQDIPEAEPDCREKTPQCADNEPCLMNEETTPDCGGEVCAYGDPDCIECSGPIDTCMDGSATDCNPDVVHFDGRGPDGCENCRDLSSKTSNVMGYGALVGLLAAVGVFAWVRKL